MNKIKSLVAPLFLLALLGGAPACGDDGGSTPDAMLLGPDAGAPDGTPGGGFDQPVFDDMGCLTPKSAIRVCCERPGGSVNECNGGAGTEPSLCGFMVACGLTNLGQCSINCGMSAQFQCVTETEVNCFINAAIADDCDAAMLCTGWL